jgi:hypothetical protein
MQLTRTQKWLATGAACLGVAAGAAGIAGAATNSSTNANSGSGAPAASPQDPAAVQHGPNETLLTGDTASKVTAAAKAAVPGGTVIRVETDGEGSPYEAHIRKADGTYVTVKIDRSFKVTSTIDGFGQGGQGGGGSRGPGAPGGPPPMNGGTSG